MYAGLLPVKPLADAKTRLSSGYDDVQRVAIARALLDDALGLCAATSASLRWWVVTADPLVRELAAAVDVDTLDDGGSGLNPALEAAVRTVKSLGSQGVLILPSDIPLATPEDVVDVLDTGATSSVVVVPSDGDRGTNALMLTPADIAQPMFGPGSLRSHVDAAAAAGLRCSVLDLPRLGLDIDTVEDIDTLLGTPGASGHTFDLLDDLRGG